MLKTREDGRVAISMRFTPLQYYQLKRLADAHNRGMNDEVVSLVERAAAALRITLDQDEEAVRGFIDGESERLGISRDEAAALVARRYNERHRIHLEDAPPPRAGGVRPPDEAR